MTPSRDGERDASRRLPRNLRDAVAIPLPERARLLWSVRESSFDAEPFNAHAWPELVPLVESFRRHADLPHAKTGPWPHPTTRRLVELLAVHQPSELEQAFAALPQFAWWRERRHLGLAAISPRVLEHLLLLGPKKGALSTEELDRIFSQEVTSATA